MKILVKTSENKEIEGKEGKLVGTSTQEGIAMANVIIDGEEYTLPRANCELLFTKGLTNL